MAFGPHNKPGSGLDHALESPDQITISADLVTAAKHLLSFLKKISGFPALHGGPLLIQAIRRYRNFWMPIAAKGASVSGRHLLPPLDVHWVWLCHCLDSKAYQRFCILNYFKVISIPMFLDVSNESTARELCKSVWNQRYPYEPFEVNLADKNVVNNNQRRLSQTHGTLHPEEKELLEIVLKQGSLYKQVSQPYMCHDDFLKMTEQRYRCYLFMLHKLKGTMACVPTSDIQLMWRCHQTFPLPYAVDTERLCVHLDENESLINRQGVDWKLQAFENTTRTWEMLFGNPYERAGVYKEVNVASSTVPWDALSQSIAVSLNWHHQNFDANMKYDFLTPRHVMEVRIHIRCPKRKVKLQRDTSDLFLRMRMMDACNRFVQDVPIPTLEYDNAWHNLWWMQCEVSSRGLILELRSQARKCFQPFSKPLTRVLFTWKDLECEPLLMAKKQLPEGVVGLHSELLTSITPPVQAPYLLKALADRVTDDSGAMLSKRFWSTKPSTPQEGRWMSSTVLNHSGKECFIIRTRVATGAWRNKNERPVGVDWNERIIHVHGGGWNYIGQNVGITSDKILATATPLADELEQYKMKWSFSTGETLTIQMPIENPQWERQLRFSIKGSHHGMVRLRNGRCLQYEVPSSAPEEEEGFVTVVRYNPESRQARATALFNWKISTLEVLPEEDVVFVILLCTATQRSVADLGGRTLQTYYKRKKMRKQLRKRNWGSLVMGGRAAPPELMFWYVNPENVLQVNLAAMENDEVLPKGGSYRMYRGTSWLYAGNTTGLYRMSSKASFESFGFDGGDHFFGLASYAHFGAQSKLPW